MSRKSVIMILLVAAVAVTSQAAVVFGALPSETLLPSTTKGYLSIPDIDELRNKWEQTQMGQLANDPVMKPFVEDLQRQIREKLSQSGVRLGLAWDDLDGVYGGEFCVAMIQPDGDPMQHALALLVDVTEHEDAARALLDKVDTNLKGRGATKEVREIGGTSLSVYSLPAENESLRSERNIFLFIKDAQLVAVDHERTALDILARFEGNARDSLSGLLAFHEVMSRCAEGSGDLRPLVRWFAEPLGYAQAIRAAAGGRKRRGTDLLKVLSNQGFDALQGIGGHVNFSTGEYELLHRTWIYAPAVSRGQDAESKDKYDLSFRMFDFPNGNGLEPQEWVPRELTTYATCRWNMKNAFEYASTLVDEIAGEPGFFDDVLLSLRDDPSGPQVDIRKELVAHLGQRATLISDYVTPITPKSERLMVGLELTDPAAVSAALNKAMESDPDARRVDLNGHTIWEVINEPEEEMPTLVIDGGIGLTPIPGIEEPADHEERDRLLRNSAIAVVHGQLVVATHIDLLEQIMTQSDQQERLGDSMDYRLVNTALSRLGAGEDSFRFFSRTDEEYRSTYELIRQNRMPESETLVGRLLNRLLGPEEKGILREQQIDGSKLPDYQVVRRYLGPAGAFIRSREDGWSITGAMLNKDQAYDADLDQPAISTAKVEKD